MKDVLNVWNKTVSCLPTGGVRVVRETAPFVEYAWESCFLPVIKCYPRMASFSSQWCSDSPLNDTGRFSILGCERSAKLIPVTQRHSGSSLIGVRTGRYLMYEQAAARALSTHKHTQAQ